MTTDFTCMGEPVNQVSEVDRLMQKGVIEHARVAQYLHRVPLPPIRFLFSYQQRQEQRMFFRNVVAGVYDPIPCVPLDLLLFLCLVLDVRSTLLRYVIETLFIVHGETALNMICPVDGNADNRYGPGYDSKWFQNIYPPPTTTDPTLSIMMNTL